MYFSRLMAIIGSTFFITSLISAYPYGCKKLKKRHAGKEVTIAVFYDVHVLGSYTIDEIQTLSYRTALKKLHKSEQRFLHSCEKLNSSSKSVDIIWEFRPELATQPLFICLAPEWIKRQFSDLRFIYADKQRKIFKQQLSQSNISSEAIMTIPKDLEKIINAQSGEKAWNNFKRLQSKTKRELVKRYGNASYVPFEPSLAYDRIADLEMLSAILSSQKDLIILYAGGEHAERIVSFLIKQADCELIKKVGFNQRSFDYYPQELQSGMFNFLTI